MQIDSSDYHGEILIVDDLADNLRVLSNTLSNHQYRVRAVRSGAMALMGAQNAPPDLILLDIRMPEMDGYEVCRRLRADARTREIPIIFLSALDEPTDKAKAFEVGGADYITKPFQVEEVLARVNNQLVIQQLKKQVAEQQQWLNQLPDRIADVPGGNGMKVISQDMLTAIATILDYSDRLCQAPEMASEHYAALKVIHQSGQNLLELLTK